MRAIDEATEVRRAINFEIASLERLLKTYPHQAVWIRQRIEELRALRDASGAGAPTSPAEAHGTEPPDLSGVPPWARDIVREHLDRKATEHAQAERQAAEAARVAHEEAVAAPRRAALRAPIMGHMGNRPNENFRLRGPQCLTRVVSTESQRLAAAAHESRSKEARVAAAGMRVFIEPPTPIVYASPTGVVV